MKTLLLSLTLLLSFSSFAGVEGLPDEDPIVKNLRDRFEKARTPKAKDILGKTFSCKSMSAMKGYFKKYDIKSKLSFEAFDGFYIVSYPGIKMDQHYLVDTGSELLGNTDEPQYDSYRIDENGYLLNEWTGSYYPDMTILPPITRGIPEDQMVVSYGICVAQ